MSSSSDNIRNFMGYMWYQVEDNIVTIGINEDGLEELDTITSVDLAQENEKVEADEICGTIETDDGPLDIYSPVSGKIIEVNTAVVEEPSLIEDDSYGDGWLLKIESEDTDDLDDDDEEDDDENEDEDEDYKDED